MNIPSKWLGPVLFFHVLLIFGPAGMSQNKTAKTPDVVPSLEIQLLALGFQPPVSTHYSNEVALANPALLMDNTRTRLTFVDENTLAVYFSHLYKSGDPIGAPASSPDSTGLMEAFFIDTNSGSLISRKTWETRRRRWFNDLYDTQARIIAVQDGFLVHAKNTLRLYSTDLQQKRELPLTDSDIVSAQVAPLGRTIHLGLQNGIDAKSAEGEWLNSNTFEKLYAETENAGVMSSSDDAVVERMFQCIDLLKAGESPRELCCGKPCSDAGADFLTDKEIVLGYNRGFRVLSTSGEVLWGRDGPEVRDYLVEDYKRSLNGNRLAISLYGSHRIVFDQITIPKEPYHTILVYDESKRDRVFTISAKSLDPIGLALSPNGQILAVLTGTVIRLYKIP